MAKKKSEIKETKPKIKYNTKCQIIERSDKLNNLIEKNGLDCEKHNGNKIVLLTSKNAATIEKLIENDPNYFPFAHTLYKYYKSAVGIEGIKKNKEKSLFAIIREIDRDNSTNVWRYKHIDEFNEMIKFIIDPDNRFFENLKSGDKDLPDKIIDFVSKKTGNGGVIKSLSSKTCKYLSEFMFEGDKYYINDSYVRALLLFYLDYYGVDREDLKTIHKVNTSLNYKQLFEKLDNLNEARYEKHKDGEISKSELDHIMWYCYKSFEIS